MSRFDYHHLEILLWQLGSNMVNAISGYRRYFIATHFHSPCDLDCDEIRNNTSCWSASNVELSVVWSSICSHNHWLLSICVKNIFEAQERCSFTQIWHLSTFEDCVVYWKKKRMTTPWLVCCLNWIQISLATFCFSYSNPMLSITLILMNFKLCLLLKLLYYLC